MEIAFTREKSPLALITRLIQETSRSIDAALYRFDQAELAAALRARADAGVRVRLVLDRAKYEENAGTREIMATNHLPFHLAFGRRGSGSKMHHKFAVLDSKILIVGSYNWTADSENQNHENILILQDPAAANMYEQEFEALWSEAA